MSDIEQSEYGNIIKVLYLTKEFSPETEKVIKENVTPSMISQDESSIQYFVDTIREVLMNSKTPVLQRDFRLIEYCVQNEIEYIEF